MGKYASKVILQSTAWLGCNEKNGTHKQIIDVYNSYKPHPRGYKMTYTAPWCAAFVSAVSIKLGYTDIIPVECSCSRMIEQFKKLGVYIENENRTPNIGDIVFYDWNDTGSGDNKGAPDHVGIVSSVSRETFSVIEGNYSNSVKKRTMKINGKYIRGFAVPNYDTESEVLKMKTYTVKKGDTLSKIAATFNVTVSAIQNANSNLIKNANLLSVGWVLNIPEPVQDYDAIGKAAIKFFNDVKSLDSYKNLTKLIL